MTEARLENRATPIPNGEAPSGPVVAKTTTTTTKLNPSAKSFVFNTAAPVWTPPSFTAAPVAPAAATTAPLTPSSPAFVPATSPLTPSSPAFVPAAAPATVASPAPKLKAAAKPFIPSFLAKPFVPTFAAAPGAAPAVPAPEPATPAPTKDTAVATTATDAAVTAEPELEDIKETTTTATTSTDVVETASTVVTTETTVVTTETAVTTTVVSESTTTTTTSTTSDAAAAVEQAAIGARLMYSIAKLLELEPESCPMPPSVVGLPVAAETTGKAANTFAQDAGSSSSSKSSRGGRRGNGNDSSRSLNRSNSNYSDGGSRGNGRRGGGGRGGRGHHNVHDTAPAAEDCAPLEINEATRWKPSHSKSRLDAPEDTTEASLKEAKAILNKLSIEKFEKLSNELIAVAVRNIDVLTGVIETIILKAKMEWHFSTMYAELCTKMARTQMPAVTIDNEVVEDTHKLFRRLLLKRCEQEFREAPSRDGFELLPPDEVAEKELILKRGILGHIRFVGELYKLQMIKSRIMHQCIANLFGDTEKPDEESLECLTKLLATIGQVFETTATSDGERAAIAQYYAVIKALSQNASQLSTRIRFMLQDLLELRKNRWVARRKETKAMTIAEVHAEAKREADEKAKASASGGGSARLQRSQSMNAASDRRRSNGSSTGGGASDAWKARAAASSSGLSSVAAAPAAPTVDADGWETVASGKPKLVKSRSNSDRFPVASTVASSPSGAAGRPPKSAAGRKDAPASSAGGRNGRRDRDRSGSASSVGGSFSALRRGASLTDLGRPPTASSPALVKSASSSSSSDAETTSSSKPKTPALSADVFGKKIKAILDEYAETQDLDEATQCVVELASDEHHVLIATTTLNIGLEKGTKERAAVATLLAGLHARSIISTDDIATPLHELLEFAEDMEIDIPLTLQYVAEMISPSIASGAVPLARLVASVQHLASTGKAAKVVSKTLVAVNDDARVKALVSEAALDFATLLAEADRTDAAVNAYLTDAKLSCLLA